MIISILAIVLAVASLVYSIHVAVVFHRFNDGIKDWAEKLDDNTQIAINMAARRILSELDEKISKQKEDEIENVEPLNEENNE